MAFFDELGKKISQAGQTAVQKTKGLTDIARINGLIADEEKKIRNTYLQIGKQYVALHGADCEDAFAGMVATIRNAEAAIRDYRQQIEDIKGITRCAVCGAELPNSVAFCSACGTPVPRQETPTGSVPICTGCGAAIAPGMRFCATCGLPVTELLRPLPLCKRSVPPAACRWPKARGFAPPAVHP